MFFPSLSEMVHTSIYPDVYNGVVVVVDVRWWSSLGVSHDVYPGQAFPVERLRVLFHQLFAVLEVVHAFPAITFSQTFPDQLRFLDVDHGLARLVLSLTHERHRVRPRRRRVEV